MHDFTPSLRPTICIHCWLTADDPSALHIDRQGVEFCPDPCRLWTVRNGICISPLHEVGWGWLAWKDQLDKDPMVTRWLPDGRRVGRRHRGRNPEAAAKTLAEREQSPDY